MDEDDVASSAQPSPFRIREIARNLFHPFAIRLLRNPGNLDSANLQIEDEEHEIPSQAHPREHLDTEEVRYRDGTPMSLEKGLPSEGAGLPPSSLFERMVVGGGAETAGGIAYADSREIATRISNRPLRFSDL